MRSTVARASTRMPNTAAVPHGLFDGHAHAGHLAARLGDEFQQAQNGLPIGEDIVYQKNHVVPVQVFFRDPQGIGLLQREGVGFGRVDLRIDVPGLELLRIDRRDIQSSCYKTGQGDTGAFRSQYLGDPHTPETLCQRVSHVLHQIYIHTVIEEHVHVDDVPLADHRIA